MLDGTMARVAAHALQDVKFLMRSVCKGHVSGVSVELDTRAIDLSEYPCTECVANACDSLRRVGTGLWPWRTTSCGARSGKMSESASMDSMI